MFRSLLSTNQWLNPAGIYLLKVNNRITRTRCEICSKLTIKAPEQRYWDRSDVFNINVEHILQLVLVMVAAPPNFRGGDLKISDKNNWRGPDQKIKFEGELNLRGDLQFEGGL